MNIKTLTAALWVSALIVLSAARAAAQTTTWNDSQGDSSWSNASNWSNGSPATLGSSAVVQIGTNLTDGIVVDTGGPVSIATLTFNSSLTSSDTLGAGGTETLQVNGAITNSSTFNQNLILPVIAGTSTTYTGGSGGLTFSSLTVNTNSVATSGTVKVNGQLVFTINSNAPGGYGTIGNITTSGSTTISTGGTYAGAAGDFFKLSTGNLIGASVNGNPTGAPGNPTSLPTLNSGLVWVQSLVQHGILIVQPTTGNIVNTGVTLPIDNDAEFNTGGITFNGGELVTSNNSLNTGLAVGTPFSTSRAIGINTTGGTIAASTGTTATYTSGAVISNGNGSTGTVTVGDSTNKGTVVFAAANTYGGGTTVSGGTLTMSNGTTGSATGSGALSVASGATIGGVGQTISSSFAINGNVTVGNGIDTTSQTTIKAGAVLHNSSFTGANLTFNLNEANTNSNELNVGSTGIDFTNTKLTINPVGSANILPNTFYILIAGVNSSGLGGVNGSQYSGFTVAANSIAAGKSQINLSGNGGLGNLALTLATGSFTTLYGGSYLFLDQSGGVDNIDLMVVPEPSAWAMLLVGLGLLVVRYRLRRKL